MSLLGAVFHYFVLNITLWWFFHVCSIFYKVMFPLTAKQYEKKEKYFHIVLLVTGMFHCIENHMTLIYEFNQHVTPLKHVFIYNFPTHIVYK